MEPALRKLILRRASSDFESLKGLIAKIWVKKLFIVQLRFVIAIARIFDQIFNIKVE